jgi:hypothetical protein
MKRPITFLIVAVAGSLAAGITHLATAQAGLCQGEHTLHEVRTFLMEQPRRFGPRLAELGYGTTIVASGPAEGVPGWCVVEHEDQRGFVQAQAFTPGRVLRSGQEEGRAGGDQQTVQLAARGFSPEIEARHRAENPGLDFSLVDAVEATMPYPDDVAGFAEEGKLVLEGGAR